MKKYSVKDIVYISLLIALNIILGRVASIRVPYIGIESVRIGFGGLPIIFAGIAIDPLAGGIVGGVGDLLGYFIGSTGQYMPHFTMTAALTGIIPGFLLRSIKKSDYSLWQLIIAIAIGQTITSIIMVPYFLNILFNVPLVASLPGNLINQAIHIPLYAYMIHVIVKRLVPYMGLSND
ncbi:MAG: folate family ECF transporter S component [Clostridiales bacterium]|nr:folate family ECF transporter S component [Clostridiales bacterium]